MFLRPASTQAFLFGAHSHSQHIKKIYIYIFIYIYIYIYLYTFIDRYKKYITKKNKRDKKNNQK